MAIRDGSIGRDNIHLSSGIACRVAIGSPAPAGIMIAGVMIGGVGFRAVFKSPYSRRSNPSVVVRVCRGKSRVC